MSDDLRESIENSPPIRDLTTAIRVYAIILLTAFGVGVCAGRLSAQTVVSPRADSVYVHHGAPMLGFAMCTPYGADAFLNLIILAGDSATEFAAHELVHVDQFIAAKCPQRISRLQSEEWELEAYCAMRPYRMKRKRISKERANDELLRYVRASLPFADSVVVRYHRKCP